LSSLIVIIILVLGSGIIVSTRQVFYCVFTDFTIHNFQILSNVDYWLGRCNNYKNLPASFAPELKSFMAKYASVAPTKIRDYVKLFKILKLRALWRRTVSSVGRCSMWNANFFLRANTVAFRTKRKIAENHC